MSRVRRQSLRRAPRQANGGVDRREAEAARGVARAGRARPRGRTDLISPVPNQPRAPSSCVVSTACAVGHTPTITVPAGPRAAPQGVWQGWSRARPGKERGGRRSAPPPRGVPRCALAPTARMPRRASRAPGRRCARRGCEGGGRWRGLARGSHLPRLARQPVAPVRVLLLDQREARRRELPEQSIGVAHLLRGTRAEGTCCASAARGSRRSHVCRPARSWQSSTATTGSRPAATCASNASSPDARKCAKSDRYRRCILAGQRCSPVCTARRIGDTSS